MAASFRERKRLFKTPGSTWDDYDEALISKGGGVFSRQAKTIRLSGEVRKMLDVDLEEVTLAETSPLAGKTVRSADPRHRHQVLVVAVRRPTGEMIFNPDADQELAADDTLIVMGRGEAITEFRRVCEGP